MQEPIERRNKNFFKHDWESLKKDFEVSLRRKKRQDFLMTKRSIPLPIPQALQIPNFNPSQELSQLTLNSLYSTFQSSPIETCYQITLILISISYKETSDFNLLIESNCIEFCLNYILNSPQKISENLLLTLSNIAATGPEFRQKILDLNFLLLLPKLLFEQECSVSFLKTIALILQNLIQTDVKIDKTQAGIVLNALENLIALDFPKINKSCLFVVYGLSSFDELQCIECEFLVEFVMEKAGKSENDFERLLGLKVIGNFACNSYSDLKILKKKGVFEVLKENLAKQDSVLMKKCCVILVNLLESPFALEFEPCLNIIFPVLNDCISHPDISVKNESSFVLCSLANLHKKWAQWTNFELLVQNDLFSHIVLGLQKKSDTYLNNILNFLYVIMKAPDPYIHLFQESFLQSGCYETLELCQLYCNHNTSDQICNFLSEHFGHDEEEDPAIS